MMLNDRVLVLNQNYEPMSICTAKKAILLLYLEKAEMVVHNHRDIRSPSVSIKLPSIVRLHRYIHVPKKRILLTRRNIIRRDRFTCQYCNTTMVPLTLDHIIPKNRGGRDAWDNLVSACMKCNNKKGNRTPNEAGMPLLKEPKRPGYLFFIQHLIGIPDERWKPYLFLS